MLLITIFLVLLMLVTSGAGEVYKIVNIGTWTNPESGNKYDNVWRSSDSLDFNEHLVYEQKLITHHVLHICPLIKKVSIYFTQECYLVSGTPGSEHAHLSGSEHPDSVCMYSAAIKAYDDPEDLCHFVGVGVDALNEAIKALHIVLWMKVEDAPA